ERQPMHDGEMAHVFVYRPLAGGADSASAARAVFVHPWHDDLGRTFLSLNHRRGPSYSASDWLPRGWLRWHVLDRAVRRPNGAAIWTVVLARCRRGERLPVVDAAVHPNVPTLLVTEGACRRLDFLAGCHRARPFRRCG